MGQGDVRALLQRAYEQYYYDVFKKAMIFFGDRATAEDLVQDVFHKVLLELRRGNQKVLGKYYMLRLAGNLFIDHYRRLSTRREDLTADLSLFNGVETGDADMRIQLGEIMSRLPDRLKEYAYLHYIEGLTFDEIVLATRTPKRTLQRRIKKIEKLIRRGE